GLSLGSSDIENESVLKSRTPGRSHLLLQFGHKPSNEEIQALENHGVKVLSYAPDFGFFVSTNDNIAKDELRVERIYSLRPTEKISAALAIGRSVEALVEFFGDVDGNDSRSIATEASLEILENSDVLSNHLLVRGRWEQIAALANWDE